MKHKIKEILVREFKKWIYNVWDEIRKDPLPKIAILFLSPIFIYAIAQALMDFGILTTIGYYVACIYGFSKILDDPWRILKWGLGYAIGAALLPLLFTSVWPELAEGTVSSMFVAAVMVYIIFMILWKARELQKS